VPTFHEYIPKFLCGIPSNDLEFNRNIFLEIVQMAKESIYVFF
jgi:hypothetical protein